MTSAEFQDLTDSNFAKPSTDRGQWRARVKARIPGNYMLDNKREYSCTITDISSFVVTLEAEVKPELDDHVVLYLRDIGRVEGHVVRVCTRDFVLAMEMSKAKRTRIEYHLRFIANRHSLGPVPGRKDHRILPLHTLCIVKTIKGEEHVVRLVDVSISGTAFIFQGNALRNLLVGSYVDVGSHSGRIIRKVDNGVSVEFDCPIDASEFDESIVL